MAVQNLMGPAFMADFRCLGADCPDTCCAGWNVPVDAAAFVRIRTALGEEPLAEAFVANGAGAAHIDMSKTGTCAALEGSGLCGLHRRFGAQVLGDVCATYPRQARRVADRIELTGMLSCPEIARRALLVDAGEDLVDLDAAALGRPKAETLILDPDDPFHGGFDDVRTAMRTLLSVDGAPLATRLFYTLWFGQRVRPFFHRHAPDGARAQLEEAWADVARVAKLQALHDHLEALPGRPDVAVALVHGWLAKRLETATRRTFRDLVADAAATYDDLPQVNGQVDAGAVARLYLARRDAVDAVHGDRLELAWARYALHYWLADPYLERADLVEHATMLVARLAMLRFLLYSSPEADALGVPGTEAALEAHLVRVTSTFSREVEHASGFLEAVRSGLSADLAHGVLLARF